MGITVQEFVISGNYLTKEHGKIYKKLGLGVQYEQDHLKVCSTHRAKIISVACGIHIHSHYEVLNELISSGLVCRNEHKMPFEIIDMLGNKIIVTFVGKECIHKIALITSGGDSPGMNSAIKGAIRTGLRWGATMYGVYRGYDGLICNNIKKLGWDTETQASSQGGTVLLSARSLQFLEKEGRKKSTCNLVKMGINRLIIMGGDGSLAGAITLQKEFKEHFRELIKEGKITKEDLAHACDNKYCPKQNTAISSESIGLSDFYGQPECYKTEPKVHQSEIRNNEEKFGVEHFFRPDNENMNKKHNSVSLSNKYKGTTSSNTNDKQSDDAYTDGDTNNCSAKDTSMVVSGTHHKPAEKAGTCAGTSLSQFCIELKCSKSNDKVSELTSQIPQSSEKTHENTEEKFMATTTFDENKLEKYIYDLGIIGIPASIDNDIWGVSTLGADTAINRVAEALDHLFSTMRSHGRTFVIEVMGRTCGWIALMSAFSTGADYVLIPEVSTNWKKEVIESILAAKEKGKDGIFVIVSEGALEEDGTLLKASKVLEEITNNGIESRLIKLGHIQRGGPTSAQDRIYGTLLGIKAVEKLLGPACMPTLISLENGEELELDLSEVVRKTQEYKELIASRNWQEMLNRRGEFFKRAYLAFEKLRISKLYPIKKSEGVADHPHKIGILHTGVRASGMNTALNLIVQYSLSIGADPHYILNGFDGIIKNQIVRAQIYEFSKEINDGGSAIGLSQGLVDIERINRKLKEHNFDSLIIIGDSSCLVTSSKIVGPNVIVIPAAVSNNIPCTDLSIGTDTALNTILKVSDCSKLSTMSMKRNVFVIEIGGGLCGYLTLMGGIAAGAFECFIPERRYLISHLSETAQKLKAKFKEESRHGVVIFRNERTFTSMSTASFCRILKSDAYDLFETDYSVIGHLQQGGMPSPLDRINATMMGLKAVDMCLKNCGIGLIGVCGNKYVFTDMETVLSQMNLDTMTMKAPKWLKFASICRKIE